MTGFGLTEDECEVLLRAARGLNLSQSAAELGVSRTTVGNRARSATKKLGALNITHAVAVAIRNGVIEP